MILRNISFEHDLPIVDDHAASMQKIASPHLYARVVQSFLALEAGEESLEPFLFLQDDDLLDASKLLYVVTDPFHIGFANKKIMTALYGEINQLIRKKPLMQARWEKQMVELSDFIQDVTREIPLEISAPDEMTVQDVCKAFGVQLDCPLNTSPRCEFASCWMFLRSGCRKSCWFSAILTTTFRMRTGKSLSSMPPTRK